MLDPSNAHVKSPVTGGNQTNVGVLKLSCETPVTGGKLMLGSSNSHVKSPVMGGNQTNVGSLKRSCEITCHGRESN